LLADSVGLALLVVLEKLDPGERLAFVLHDMFAVPFEEIAPILGRSNAAVRQLASRARRRVQASGPAGESEPGQQREVVDAFLAAARGGDFEALVAVLHPDVVLRADYGGAPVPAGVSTVLRGARTVAGRALMFSRYARVARTASVNGRPGLVAFSDGQPVSVLGFTVSEGSIVEIDILADPERLRHLDLTMLDD
jgi:hypothetical protein